METRTHLLNPSPSVYVFSISIVYSKILFICPACLLPQPNQNPFHIAINKPFELTDLILSSAKKVNFPINTIKKDNSSNFKKPTKHSINYYFPKVSLNSI